MGWLTPTRRNLGAVIVPMAGAAFTYSFTFPLLSLTLDRRGVDSTLIGLNTAAEAVGLILVAPFAPALLRRLGPTTMMLAAIAFRLVSFLCLPLFPEIAAWFALRFVMGAAGSAMWIVSEAWINQVVEERARGRILSVYSMALAAGYACGPLLLAQTGSAGWLPFLFGAGVLAVSALATLQAHGLAPDLGGTPSASLPAYFLLAPLVMACCFVVSAADNMLVTFMPLYGHAVGLGQERALYLLTVMGIGGIVLQYPFGWIADRMVRRLLTLAIAISLALACMAFPFVIPRAPVNLAFIFAFGGLLGALYTMGNVLMGERFRGPDLASASTVFAVMWNLGALAGSPAAGLGMDLSARFGLPGAMTLLVLPIVPLAALTYLRVRRRGALL